MARQIKTFKFVEPEEAPEPWPFEFELTPRDGGDPVIERFEAMGEAPAGAQLALAQMIHYSTRGRRNIDMNGMMEFFEKVMSDEDYQRMRDLFDDKRWIIKIDAVGEVFTWLTEVYAERPTKRSRHSSPTRPGDGRTERDAVIELPNDSVAETSLT